MGGGGGGAVCVLGHLKAHRAWALRAPEDVGFARGPPPHDSKGFRG